MPRLGTGEAWRVKAYGELLRTHLKWVMDRGGDETGQGLWRLWKGHGSGSQEVEEQVQEAEEIS